MREKKLHLILEEVFGHKSFRFDQLEVINSILDGHDTLAIMPTGGGKSVCYQVPAIFSEGVTLVVSPLISLMHDQVVNLEGHGVSSGYLNSSQSQAERESVQERVLSGEIKIVYVSPEGLLSGRLSQFFQSLKLSFIAIDEAHCVSQWGHEFRKDYTRLGELKDLFPSTALLALTATADSKTRDDITKQLRFNSKNVFVSSFDRPNINYSICERDDEIKQLDNFIKEYHEGETGIIYCLSRKKVERVCEELNKMGRRSFAYHAGLSSEAREETQKAFNNEEGVLVVATIAFGMGIDRPDVRFVAHLDLPKSVEGYYQETGRAGRDGLPANAWMVYGLQDVIKLSRMLEMTEASEEYKKSARYKLETMLALCETSRCRRQHLLDYFEQEAPESCGNCDVCLEPVETWDAKVDAQKVLSTIYKTGQIYGANYIIDVLRGSKSAKVLERGHDKISVYGIGIERSKNHWNVVIRHLLNSKYISVRNWEYRSLCLNAKSGDLLRGEVSFELRKLKEQVSSKVKKKRVAHVSHDQAELFEELRQIRRTLSEEREVPPYVIFGDKSLHDMCALLPRNESEFLMVNGVGASKCEKYGSIFLRKIKEYL